MKTNPHVLYRFYDPTGQLLYIGITLNPGTRWPSHQRRAWWQEVASITLEPHPDRASVLAAERAAISAERPAYNVQHSPRPTPAPTPPRFVGPQRCSRRRCNEWAPRAIGSRPICDTHTMAELGRLHRLGPSSDFRFTKLDPVDNLRPEPVPAVPTGDTNVPH